MVPTLGNYCMKLKPASLDSLLTLQGSVSDPGFNPGSKFFHPGSRIHIKEFKYFNPKIIVSKLWEILSGLFIPDPDSGSRSRLFTHPGIRWPFTDRPSHRWDTGRGRWCCGSGMFIPDSNFSIPDPHQRIKVFQPPKIVSKL
jgi:hypothetical protein